MTDFQPYAVERVTRSDDGEQVEMALAGSSDGENVTRLLRLDDDEALELSQRLLGAADVESAAGGDGGPISVSKNTMELTVEKSDEE